MKVFIASLDTRHFSFDAFGVSKAEAESALLATIEKHAIQCHLQPNWGKALIHTAEFRCVETGEGYRDRGDSCIT